MSYFLPAIQSPFEGACLCLPSLLALPHQPVLLKLCLCLQHAIELLGTDLRWHLELLHSAPPSALTGSTAPQVQVSLLQAIEFAHRQQHLPSLEGLTLVPERA